MHNHVCNSRVLTNSREGQDVPEIDGEATASAGAELVATDRLTGKWHGGGSWGDTGARHLELLPGVKKNN